MDEAKKSGGRERSSAARWVSPLLLLCALVVVGVLVVVILNSQKTSPTATAAQVDPPVKVTRAATVPTKVPFPAGYRAQRVLTERLTGPTLGPDWKLYNGVGNWGFGLRRPSAVTVHDGTLAITATQQGANVVSEGVAMRQNVTYGRFQFKIRSDYDPTDTLAAVATIWPESNNLSRDGAIDVYDTREHAPAHEFESAIHFQRDGSPTTLRFASRPASGTWQTIVLDWTPHRLAVYDNGTLIGQTSDSAAIPHTPHHLCFQLDAVNSGMIKAPNQMEVKDISVDAYHAS